MAKKTSAAPKSSKREVHKAESFLLSALRREQPSQKNQTIFDPIAAAQRHTSFISIDEVGRGCVAGPVVVCATLWSQETVNDSFVEWLAGLRDSKKMSAASREMAFQSALAEKFFTIFGGEVLPPVEQSSTKTESGGLNHTHLRYPIHQMKWTAENLQAQLSNKYGVAKRVAIPTFK
ncbi:hypothetical protein EBR21_16655, partial [bacterium]|nr:hypothetical protein [bacterium]